MVPSGPPTPIGGTQSVSPSLLRSNSGMLGGQGGPMPSQTAFPSLVSSRTQFNNMNMLGNVPNMSSLLNQSFGNGGPNTLLSGPGSSQRGASNMVNPSSSGQNQGQQFSNSSGNQLMSDQQQSQQLESQNFQHGQPAMQQFSAPHGSHQQQQQQQQQQFQQIRGGGGVGPVKLEPQVSNDQHGQQQQQQLQSLRNIRPVKLEPQQIQTMRSLVPVKMEPQHPDQSLYLQQQQQQQQQFLHMSRQSSQAAAAAQINILNHQRFLQLQQHQQHQQHHQQQLLKMPQQRSQLQQQFQQQNLPLRPPAKSVYAPGTCARRLTHYMYQQQHRPEDNNIEFWRKFVAEYFAPHAKKRWCVSMYGMAQNSNSDQSSVQVAAMQLAAGNGASGVNNNSLNASSTSTSASTIVGLLHQNSMNSRQQNSMNASSPYGGSSVQIPSPGSSSTIPQAQPNPSPFQSPTPSSNNPPQAHGALTAANHMSTSNSPANMSVQQPVLSSEADPSDSQSSVQKILHEVMMSNQLNGTVGMVSVGSLGNDMKNVNGILPTSSNAGLNGGNYLMGNGTVNSNSGMGPGFGTVGGPGQSAMVNGIRAAMGNNSAMNGRVGMASMARDQSMNHQQDLGNQLLNGLGALNGFNNLQFDWKPSP
ncbi:hypothetical protein I3843_16G020300 [Carya illinoinensis]|nr:hypothetical protein I3843_16G020300 [Carya illinoinensis]